jgi:hypothetical protein
MKIIAFHASQLRELKDLGSKTKKDPENENRPI